MSGCSSTIKSMDRRGGEGQGASKILKISEFLNEQPLSRKVHEKRLKNQQGKRKLIFQLRPPNVHNRRLT